LVRSSWCPVTIRRVLAPNLGRGGDGKGLLATHLAGTLEEVEIRVLDVDKRAIQNGRMHSERLSLSVCFETEDVSVAQVDVNVAQVDVIDVVVALHVCRALMDVVLGHAVTNQAAFVICPCCFAFNPHVRLSNRQAVEEWLGIPAVDFSTEKRLAEILGDQSVASRAIHTICESGGRGNTQCIRTFPIASSMRNFCLVGQPRNESK
jgi:hypothetical protein